MSQVYTSWLGFSTFVYLPSLLLAPSLYRRPGAIPGVNVGASTLRPGPGEEIVVAPEDRGSQEFVLKKTLHSAGQRKNSLL